MLKPAKFIRSLLFAGFVMASASPLAAKTAQECYDAVIKECTETLADSNFIQKVAVGVVCTARLASCYATYQ